MLYTKASWRMHRSCNTQREQQMLEPEGGDKLSMLEAQKEREG